MDFLVATLAAPLASFGGPSANEFRKDAGGPLRSSIVGLLSACLGFERTAESEMAELSRRVGILVRMDRPGDPMVDYHTTQSASDGALRRWEKAHGQGRPTRRQYLVNAKAARGVETSLSRREYRTDAVLTLLLWERGGADGSLLLAQLADAMRRPVFLPTLGRKACHLNLPMNPRLVSAPDLIEAMRRDPISLKVEEVFAASKVSPTGSRQSRPPLGAADFVARSMRLGNMRLKAPVTCHCDMDAPLGEVPPMHTLSYRRDEPRDRSAWTFAERREMTFSLPGREAA